MVIEKGGGHKWPYALCLNAVADREARKNMRPMNLDSTYRTSSEGFNVMYRSPISEG